MTALVEQTAQPAQATRWLWAGVVAGPLFVVLSFAQVPLHEGFDLTKHAFSFLLLGDGGWLQTCNFVLTGTLYLLSGVGLRQALGGGIGRSAQVLIAAVGIGMITAGLFPPDPAYGYPEGAPAGVPADFSISGILHGLAFVLSMLAWCGLLTVLGVSLRRSDQRSWAIASLITALALLGVPAVSSQSFGTVVLYVVASVAFVMTSALLAHVSSHIGRNR